MQRNRIAELIKIVAPPAKPLDNDESVLARNESVLRIKFPSDYLEFGSVFGSGTFTTAYSWEIWSPFRSTYPLIVMEFARIWNIYREALEITDVPFGIFPEVGGLLPFAKTADGDWVCWQTQGEPDTWSVVDFGEYQNGSYELLGMGFSDYLVSVFTRQVVLKRHKNGDSWDPTSDVRFTQQVFTDQY